MRIVFVLLWAQFCVLAFFGWAGHFLRGMNEDQSITPLQQGVRAITDVVKTLPLLPGVYRMVDDRGRVLYVGKAKALKKRVASYTRPQGLPLRLQRMIARTRTMEIITTHTEAEALLLETNMIKELSPEYNVLMKDDKSFPYLFIGTNHDFPRLRIFRGSKREKGEYYGPFMPSMPSSRTLITLQRAFQLRNCSDSEHDSRTRPCLQYHIKRCTAPCVGYVSEESYAEQVSDLKAFLSGRDGEIQKKLSQKMEEASEALEFERAAAIRDRIQALSTIQNRQDINVKGLKDADIFAIATEDGRAAVQVFFYRGGRNFGNAVFFPTLEGGEDRAITLEAFIMQYYERYPLMPDILVNTPLPQADLIAEVFTEKLGRNVNIRAPMRGQSRRLMDKVAENARQSLARKSLSMTTERKAYQALMAHLSLSDIPNRVEVYDNSHTGGVNAVGGMVVAGPEGLRKSAYRQFNIKQAGAFDDVDMMREVIFRRFSKAQIGGPDWPDLIIIDGGKGQLSAVMAVLAELGMDDQLCVLAVAKGEEREAGREKLFLPEQEAFMLSPDDPALHLIQRLRDEAHRFAIGVHRQKRGKAMVRSSLDEIKGIGAKRKKALLAHFGSAKAVAKAGVEDLSRVEGVSRATAQMVYDYFHEG